MAQLTWIAPSLIKIQDKQRLLSVYFIWDRKHLYLFVLGFFSPLCHFDWTVKPVHQFSREVNWWNDNFLILVSHLSHDMTKPTIKVTVRPAKTQISLGIRPVWSEASLSTWWKLGPSATSWGHSEDSDQTGQMPRLIWVFAGRTVTLLVLSCRGSFVFVLWLGSYFLTFELSSWSTSPFF